MEEPFPNLPKELIFHILSFLEISELSNLSYVSRGFCNLICENIQEIGKDYLLSKDLCKNSLFEYCTILRWLHLNIEQGDIDSICFTALLYEYGLLGISKDNWKAFQLYKLAISQQNDDFAKSRLSELHCFIDY